MSKLRKKEVKLLAQCHPPSKFQSRDSNPGFFATETMLGLESFPLLLLVIIHQGEQVSKSITMSGKCKLFSEFAQKSSLS